MRLPVTDFTRDEIYLILRLLAKEEAAAIKATQRSVPRTQLGLTIARGHRNRLLAAQLLTQKFLSMLSERSTA